MSTETKAKHSRDATSVILATVVSLILAGLLGGGAIVWKQLDQSKQNQAALANQVKALGGTPVVEPKRGDPGTPGAPGPQGRQGVPGSPPSAAQVAAAVASYCTGGRCAGKGPSSAQVAAAVSAYCNAKGQCRGPDGVPGSQGSPGSDGSDGSDGQQGPAGPQGPGPTDAQVAAGVTAYCGQDSKPCQGPTGAQGRGVVSFECVDAEGTSHWLITYNREDADGKTTQTVDGPCRIPPTPAGTPTLGTGN